MRVVVGDISFLPLVDCLSSTQLHPHRSIGHCNIRTMQSRHTVLLFGLPGRRGLQGEDATDRWMNVGCVAAKKKVMRFSVFGGSVQLCS